MLDELYIWWLELELEAMCREWIKIEEGFWLKLLPRVTTGQSSKAGKVMHMKDLIIIIILGYLKFSATTWEEHRTSNDKTQV